MAPPRRGTASTRSSSSSPATTAARSTASRWRSRNRTSPTCAACRTGICRYELTAVDGVSEVAAVGGFVKQYQVVVDPVKLLAYDIPLQQVKMAIQRSNVDVGGRLIEHERDRVHGARPRLPRRARRRGDRRGPQGGASRSSELRTERALDELRQDRARRQRGRARRSTSPTSRRSASGPDIRRGVAEWNGDGEVVGGIVVMRFGENARTTIDTCAHEAGRARARAARRASPSTSAYDRSDLIERAVRHARPTR